MGLDMYLLKNKNFDFGKEVCYWRKSNAIHNWFVNNIQDGKDDCGLYPVSKEKIKELETNFKGPENMKEQILEGQMKKAFADKVLMNQPYILDDTKTVEQFIKESIAKTGENITVRQFKRIELGVTE